MSSTLGVDKAEGESVTGASVHRVDSATGKVVMIWGGTAEELTQVLTRCAPAKEVTELLRKLRGTA